MSIYKVVFYPKHQLYEAPKSKYFKTKHKAESEEKKHLDNKYYGVSIIKIQVN